MELKEFEYTLPTELIATEPTEKRDQARLLVLDKDTSKLTDDFFYNLPTYLTNNDVLVFNDSKVIPARLTGTSNNKTFEVLLVKNREDANETQDTDETWECWVRPGRKAKAGDTFTFSKTLTAVLKERDNDIFIFDFNLKGQDFFKEIERIGQMPIPPYILKARDTKQEKSDLKNYQTIYAKTPGSVAAPTAGLHFDQELLSQLNKNGIQTEMVTLHVSLGTFQPINTEIIEDFKIHREYFEVSKETAERLTRAKKEGKRIIAVGTTSVRVLESAAEDNTIKPTRAETEIYIYPGYKFQFVDGMITNFHLPKSSLLLLVSAFAGRENILKSYNHAIENKYRFYSYGDGMLII
jgi:S-adenosylmethionine:tRNA ribosyltransferase-isomerase